MLDYIASHITKLLTLILAIVATVGVILSYLYRPTKLEVEKRHSDDLKKVIDYWKTEVNDCSPKSPFDIKSDNAVELNIPVEKEYYFRDIKNHLPSDLNLIESWEQFKKSWYDYEKKRYLFFEKIRDYISDKIGFPWLQYAVDWNKKSGFSSELIKYVYDDLERISQGRESFRINYKGEIVTVENKVMFKLSNYALWDYDTERVKKAVDSYYKIFKNLPNSQFVVMIKDLIIDFQKLSEEREIIKRKLNYVSFIPLLPGKCKYIRWSLPGFIEKLKNKLKLTVRFVKRK